MSQPQTVPSHVINSTDYVQTPSKPRLSTRTKAFIAGAVATTVAVGAVVFVKSKIDDAAEEDLYAYEPLVVVEDEPAA